MSYGPRNIRATEAAFPRAFSPRPDKPALLAGPILPLLLKLALPILVVLAVQTLVGLAETYFVSSLGTAALAGVALVFPVSMLMTMMSNGGIGGGVASAVARAVGSGRMEDADALVLHAVVVAAVFGSMFTAGFIGAGPALYVALGGSGEVLSNALRYSNLVFGASVLIWIVNLLAAALRGAGNVKVPATVTALGAATTLVLSPLLIFGWGPVRGFGVAGAGLAMIAYYLMATAALIAYLRSSRSPVRLLAAPLRWRLFNDILGVGLVSAAGTFMANVTVMIAVGFVGTFGAGAIAGYGIASRLDYLLIPLLFAIGTASVTMVGMNVGAGQVERARRVAWTATAVSATGCGVVGGAAFLVPQAWTRMFSQQADVISTGSAYLHVAAPFYVLYGAGMALYFASQGAGMVRWPLIASVNRIAIVVVGGWYWVSVHHGTLNGLFAVLAASYVVFGVINIVAFAHGTAWKRLRVSSYRNSTQFGATS
jgi:putative MATE family efflux protein